MALTERRMRLESLREDLLERVVAWLDDPRYPLAGLTEESRYEWRDLRDLYRSEWRELQAAEEQHVRLARRAKAEAGGAAQEEHGEP